MSLTIAHQLDPLLMARSICKSCNATHLSYSQIGLQLTYRAEEQECTFLDTYELYISSCFLLKFTFNQSGLSSKIHLYKADAVVILVDALHSKASSSSYAHYSINDALYRISSS